AGAERGKRNRGATVRYGGVDHACRVLLNRADQSRGHTGRVVGSISSTAVPVVIFMPVNRDIDFAVVVIGLWNLVARLRWPGAPGWHQDRFGLISSANRDLGCGRGRAVRTHSRLVTQRAADAD